MQALLTATILWLAANFALPATTDLPAIRFVPPIEIAFLHHGAFTAEGQRQVLAAAAALPPGERREVVSAYDDRRRTIILPLGWQGATPAELSVLVHEMVHHLQTVAGLRYPCSEAREKLAYAAQDKWLGLFGQSLESEFRIDAFTLLATTECGM